MSEDNTSTSTRATCPYCQHTGPLDAFQLQHVLKKTPINCEQCAGPMILACEDQLKRFERLGSTGMVFMLVITLSAVTVVVAIALKWLGVIRGDTQLMTSVIATAVGITTLFLAKATNEFTFELQAPAPSSPEQLASEDALPSVSIPAKP
ncbi:hypothetical protein [Aquipseudomonas guryensis]|uniref:Uncharacterized protein n=1 Tax=Aquipseudomonas guryensis TaxID=2759165 RepID=A0A7W4D9H5_9GAMM|nr:hypothetical protein [Pseudomonas guryensis]MBB1518491.1 hypothetical protein [Pseudomonas guryensis]